MDTCTLVSLLAHLWLTVEVLSAALKSPGVFLYVQSSVHPHLSFHIIYLHLFLHLSPPPRRRSGHVSQGRGFHISLPSGCPVENEEMQRKRGEEIDIQRFDGLSVSG